MALFSFERESASDLTLCFYTSGFSGIAAWWLDKDMPISSRDAAHLITRDILPGYLSLLRRELPD